MAKERVMFLYLYTGGGHISAARALAARMPKLYPDAETFLVNPLPRGDRITRFILEDGYRVGTSRYHMVYPYIYEFTKLPPLMNLATSLMSSICFGPIFDWIVKKKIDKVVVLHFLLIRPVAQVLQFLRMFGFQLSAVSICLDPFTTHPFWIYRQRFPEIVFSERLKKEFTTKYRGKADSIHVYPIILREEFDHPIPADAIPALKATYGFNPQKRLVLIAGGGEGFPKGEKYIASLAISKLDFEIAIVCGKDEKLRSRAEEIAATRPDRNIKIYGFIGFIFDLMNMADIIVAKAGPATVMEALVLRKPLIITQYIYGQEKGNVQYVIDNGLGYYINDPLEMRREVETLFGRPERYSRILWNIDRARIRNGTDEICAYIHDMKPTAYKPLLPIPEKTADRIHRLIDENGR